MQPLAKSLRTQLEKTVKAARTIAESAARAALDQLGVGEAAPSAYLSEAERELRRKLRIHGRQLGDERNARGEQAISRLLEEVAYQHWHRMLFARFLAENSLLMYPDPTAPIGTVPVAVTLEECEELAADEGATEQLLDSATLVIHARDILDGIYERAVLEAMEETGLPLSAFPAINPRTLEEWLALGFDT